MANSYFRFKQFTIQQEQCAMKVTTDACLFGAWVAEQINSAGLTITNCLDVGTGTGLLSLMLVQKNPDVHIDAIEIDKAAAEQAMENVEHSPWPDKIQLIHKDVNEFSNKPYYDLIISNPPFYENELKSPDLSKNIAHHSAELTLQQLLWVIKNRLGENGIFMLLLPCKRHSAIKEMISSATLSITHLTFVRQSTNHDFFRVMIAGRLKQTPAPEIAIDEIYIKDNSLPASDYSAAFKNLLKDYYLHL